MAQARLVSNSAEIENKLSCGDGKVGKVLAEKERRPLMDLVEELYLGSPSWLLNSDEINTATRSLDG